MFDVITPICAVCVNKDVNNKCKARGEKEPKGFRTMLYGIKTNIE